jgi:hypothetical protein
MKIYLIILSFIITTAVIGQENKYYNIVNKNNVPLEEIIAVENALKNANFENYRMKSERRILIFDSGLEVHLFSVKEIKEMGGLTSFNGLEEISQTHKAVFTVKNGYIIENHNKELKYFKSNE